MPTSFILSQAKSTMEDVLCSCATALSLSVRTSFVSFSCFTLKVTMLADDSAKALILPSCVAMTAFKRFNSPAD